MNNITNTSQNKFFLLKKNSSLCTLYYDNKIKPKPTILQKY